jgi:DNA-binding transcriptional LysR family regulator
MRTTLRRLEVFVAAVEAGGFRACSDLLDISPAAVSHQVSQLEAELGCQLFTRQRGRVCGLTAQGARAYRDAKEMLGHATHFEATAGLTKRSASRRLSVFSDAILDEYLAKHVAAFGATHAPVDVTLKRSYFEEMVEALGKRQADVAWFYSAGPVAEISSEFAWWEPVSICARHDHGVFSKGALTLRELRSFPFIAPPAGMHFRRSVDALLEQHGLEKYNIVLESGHANVAREAVINGFAISAVITRYLDEELLRHGVRAVPILDCELALQVRRALRRDLLLDPAVSGFTQFVDRAARALPPHTSATRSLGREIPSF